MKADHADKEVIKYSVAKVNITPDYPVYQDGYGSRTGKSDGKYNDLYIKSLCLEHGGEKILFIACDTCIIKEAHVLDVKSRIETLYRIKPDHVLIGYTHTHSGPALYKWLKHGDDPEYTRFFFDKMLEAVASVVDCREEGTLRYGQGETYIGVNRRRVNRNNHIDLAPNIDGETDRVLSSVSVHDSQGSPKVIASSCACHPIAVNDDRLSSDFPGVACSELERTYPGAVAMFFQGCCGDINPIAYDGFDSAVMLGKVYANDVRNVLEHMSKPFSPSFSGCSVVLRVPLSCFESERFKEIAASDDVFFKQYGNQLLKSIEEGTAPREIPVDIACIALSQDLKIVALAGEAVCGYANWLRQNCPESRLMILGYANGYCGYIPTARILAEGGYEADVSYEWIGLPGRYSSHADGLIKQCMLALCRRPDR
jgi:neutral ceramidase